MVRALWLLLVACAGVQSCQENRDDFHGYCETDGLKSCNCPWSTCKTDGVGWFGSGKCESTPLMISLFVVIIIGVVVGVIIGAWCCCCKGVGCSLTMPCKGGCCCLPAASQVTVTGSDAIQVQQAPVGAVQYPQQYPGASPGAQQYPQQYPQQQPQYPQQYPQQYPPQQYPQPLQGVVVTASPVPVAAPTEGAPPPDSACEAAPLPPAPTAPPPLNQV